MRIKALLEQPRMKGLLQFIKFGIVGLSNTAISYGIEMLCYYLLFRQTDFSGIAGFLTQLGLAATGETVRIIVTSVLAFVVSVANSYYWNSRYVFKSEGKRTFGQHARAFIKTMTCYAVTGLLIAPAIKLWLTSVGIPYWAASLGSLVVTIPLNFVLNKYWAFHNRSDAKDE